MPSRSLNTAKVPQGCFSGGPRNSTPRAVSWRYAASLGTIAIETGLSKSSVQNAVRQLTERRQLITATRDGPTSPPLYEVLKPWVRD